MKTPRYLHGCSAGSQEREETSSRAPWSSSDVRVVNFNNGNVNNQHINNNARVRAVRVWSGPLPVGQ